MTEDLERRYRRLLSLYPTGFRRDRGQEILAVLMAGADAGQRWPRLAEAGDLLAHAASMRARQVSLITRTERRHPGPWLLVRAVVGLWLTVLTALICQVSLWGLALLAPAALNFYLAYRIAATIGSESDGAPPFRPPSGLGT